MICFSVQQLQHIPIEMGSPIIQCSVADPYILIMSDEGQLMMLTLKQDAQGGRLVLSKPLIASVSQILLVSNFNYTPGIYADGYIVFAFPFVRSYVR